MRTLVLFACLVAPTAASAQLADPDPPVAPIDAERPPDPRAPSPDLGPPVAITAVGGAGVLAGAITLSFAGFQSIGSIDDLDGDLVWGGTFAAGLGVAVLFGGLAWLLDLLEGDPEQARADPPGTMRF